MEPILFYGVPEGCSFGSIVALEWSGLPYRLCRVEMPGEVKGEAYRRINPLGATPSLLTESGEIVSQSLAILHHIAARAVRPLGPRPGEPGFDRLNEMLSFLVSDFFGAFSPLWQAFEGAQGEQKAALEGVGRRKVKTAFAELEHLLGGRAWLVGEAPTTADAYLVGIVRWNDFHQVLDRRAYPALDNLCVRLEQDPAVRFAHAIEHGQPAESAGGFLGPISLQDTVSLLRSHR